MSGLQNGYKRTDFDIALKWQESDNIVNAYHTLDYFSAHYKLNFYAARTSYDMNDHHRGQYRQNGLSNTVTLAIAGDIFLAPTHSEAIVRYNRVARYSNTFKLMNATCLALSNYFFKLLSNVKLKELSRRITEYSLHRQLFTASNEIGMYSRIIRGTANELCMNLFQNAPIVLRKLSVPTDTLIHEINIVLNYLYNDHSRFNFTHKNLNRYRDNCGLCPRCHHCFEPIPSEQEREPQSLSELTAYKAHKVCVLALRKLVIDSTDIEMIYPNIPKIIRQLILHLRYGEDSPFADQKLRSQVNNLLIAAYTQRDEVIRKIGKKYSAGFLPNTVFAKEYSKYGGANDLFLFKILDEQFLYEINRMGLSIFHAADSEVFIVKRTPLTFPLFLQQTIQMNENARKRYEKHFERLADPLEVMYKGAMGEALDYFSRSRTWLYIFHDLPDVPGLIRDHPFIFSPALTEYHE